MGLLYTAAQARDMVARNVADLVTTPRGRQGRPSKALTLDQAAAVMAQAQTHWLYAYVPVSLLTGVRTEEARAGVNVAELALEVSGVRAGRVHGLDAARPELALNACGCGCCHDEASDPVALNAGFVASIPGAVEVPVAAGAQDGGVGRAGAGGWRDAAAAGAGIVRVDAGGQSSQRLLNLAIDGGPRPLGLI